MMRTTECLMGLRGFEFIKPNFSAKIKFLAEDIFDVTHKSQNRCSWFVTLFC